MARPADTYRSQRRERARVHRLDWADMERRPVVRLAPGGRAEPTGGVTIALPVEAWRDDPKEPA